MIHPGNHAQTRRFRAVVRETAAAKKPRRERVSTEDFIIVSFVFAFAFYIYSLHDFFLGVISGAFFGSFTFLLLKSAKPYGIRSVFVAALTFVMWIAFAAFLIQIGPFLFRWIESHQLVPLTPSSISDYGFVSILCPFLLPFSVVGEITVNMPLYVRFWATFPPNINVFAIILAAYLTTAMVLGKGFCGWLCPFGGLGEGFRHANRSAKAYSALKGLLVRFALARGVDLSSAQARLAMRDVKYAVLLVTLMLALTFGVQWFCVFCWAGILSWFRSTLNILVAAVVASLFFIGLPLISGRKWCHSICPVGAALSLLDRVTPFRVVVDREKCTDCDACLSVCPTFGFVKSSTVIVGDTCDKCLVCVGKCPYGAVDLKMYNLKVEPKKFLIPAVTLSASIWFLWFLVVDFSLAKLQLLGVLH